MRNFDENWLFLSANELVEQPLILEELQIRYYTLEIGSTYVNATTELNCNS